MTGASGPTVTIQTADAENPTYTADKRTIFNGFQLSFPND
ncbi:hypothetical protein CCUG60885_00406 [Mycobacteroides salmoniphilum]|uniref:Uncharacterized protein n=1 Tax=Mycobacteroides salmoniphilum TaxID=404941 RepID=A0A4R8SLF9_9MYCO|nr:hypothetical protein CCUG60885_00406 [Mycobacteroides salmoniphilum]TEA03066.1 hypothetical protein CCUG60883_03690 [Mycobacteroides salmoniphilum]